jgi:Fic family protein
MLYKYIYLIGNENMMHRSGVYKKNLHGELAYTSFSPSQLPPNPPITLDDEGLCLLARANRQLGILDGISVRIPHMDLFISMYVRKEALLSSQIEGTQATFDDILDPALTENINQNVAGVVNYIKATEFALDQLKKLPLCNRLLKGCHQVLMEGVRGEEKYPGQFRRSQNWIGPQGSTLKNASYIPPSPEDMNEAMSALEKFINTDDEIDTLVKAALIHYQFETIHPFLDGNGRVGRLLILLFLLEKKYLHRPVLYISYFLKANRIEYYDRMMEIRRKGNFEQWVKFFLKAVYESAEDAIQTIDRMTALHHKNVQMISSLGRNSGTALQIFTYLETSPIIEIKRTAAALGLSDKTVANTVKVLMEIGILIQTAKTGRTRNFAYNAYLEILRKST